MITEVKNRMMKSEEVFPLLSYSHFKCIITLVSKRRGSYMSVTQLRLVML